MQQMQNRRTAHKINLVQTISQKKKTIIWEEFITASTQGYLIEMKLSQKCIFKDDLKGQKPFQNGSSTPILPMLLWSHHPNIYYTLLRPGLVVTPEVLRKAFSTKHTTIDLSIIN